VQRLVVLGYPRSMKINNTRNIDYHD
jgi:hypothetical protein